MQDYLYREYKFRFYLNASHYIYINGVEGDCHPHTWEFTVCIRMMGQEFVQFGIYEDAIKEFFDQYQNRVINEIAPFDHIIPTLENMTDYFVHDLRKIVEEQGAMLLCVESSETPTRVYSVSLEQSPEFVEHMKRNTNQQIDEVIDSVLDQIIE